MAVTGGAMAGTSWPDGLPWPWAPLGAAAALGGAWTAWVLGRHGPALALTLAGYFSIGAALASGAARQALNPPLRDVLDTAYGQYRLDTLGPGGAHDPIETVVRLVEDASVRDQGVSLRGTISWLDIDGRRLPAAGGVQLHVNGDAAPSAAEWRAGRVLKTFATFRRPARYLNDGVGDAERDLALSGVALSGTVKSAQLVQVVARGSVAEELAAAVRAHVRAAVAATVGRSDPVRAGVVTAILIGDRTGLPPDVRERLQAAGTYHVIAISGGNIAILVVLMLGLLTPAGVGGRTRSAMALAGLMVYAAIVTPGPSVWRAVLAAAACLVARVMDQRTTAWNAMGVAGAAQLTWLPLEVRNAGFALTFGATAALLAFSARAGLPSGRPERRGWILLRWLAAAVGASLAVEVALLPVGARAFSRISLAGPLLNLLALPLMTLTQIAGIVIAVAGPVEGAVQWASWVADRSTGLLLDSARLVEVAPWLAWRVPAPSWALVGAYYGGLALLLSGSGWRRRSGGAVLGGAALAIGMGVSGPLPRPDGRLHLTVFDVGQGDALLVTSPGGRRLLVDSGGVGFGSSSFDIGARVLGPALWARGIRRLDGIVLTHADPDHAGGAPRLIADFTPPRLWEGIEVPGHPPSTAIRRQVSERGMQRIEWRRGDEHRLDQVRIRVLHPPEPDWERIRVRNDDSVVLEVVYGQVAFLLTGDVGQEVERAIVPALSPVARRVLKVGHHGSRSSTSVDLLTAWPPELAVISSGRGNPFGHPAPEVLARLQAAGTRVLRTDLDGQIEVSTDGRHVTYSTYRQPSR